MSNPTTPDRQILQGFPLPHTSSGLQQSSPGLDPLAYHRCGAIDKPTLGMDSGPRIASARCRHCGHFIRWLSTRSPGERQPQDQQVMAQWPPTPLQLAQALGDDNPIPPGRMLETSQRIDALVHGEAT